MARAFNSSMLLQNPLPCPPNGRSAARCAVTVARPFGPAYKIGVTDVFAATFSGHAKELENAFEKLNGLRLPLGDVGYQIDAFSCEPMQFYFWDCDDEFEAQANILFDYSATDFNHVESAVSTAEMGVRRLAELAGLPLKGKTFEMS